MTQAQTIEERLDGVEALLREVRTVLYALLHARSRESGQRTEVQGYSAESVGAWIEGEIKLMTGGDVPPAEADTEVVGHMMGFDSQHYPYCSTRFMCPSRGDWPGCG